MPSDTVLRYSLVVLGAVVLGIGLYTSSFKKMIATYAFGIVAISGLLLPDWEFFNRDFSHWFSPMPSHDNSNPSSTPQRSHVQLKDEGCVWFQENHKILFRIYPMRLVGFTVLYGFGLYKWWKFVSS